MKVWIFSVIALFLAVGIQSAKANDCSYALNGALAKVLKIHPIQFSDICKTEETLIRDEQVAEEWNVVVTCKNKPVKRYRIYAFKYMPDPGDDWQDCQVERVTEIKK